MVDIQLQQRQFASHVMNDVAPLVFLVADDEGNGKQQGGEATCDMCGRVFPAWRMAIHSSACARLSRRPSAGALAAQAQADLIRKSAWARVTTSQASTMPIIPATMHVTKAPAPVPKANKPAQKTTAPSYNPTAPAPAADSRPVPKSQPVPRPERAWDEEEPSAQETDLGYGLSEPPADMEGCLPCDEQPDRPAPAMTGGAQAGDVDERPARPSGTMGGMSEYPSEQPPEFAEGSVELAPCELCGRQFNLKALAKHTKICNKVFQKKAKVNAVDAERQKLKEEAHKESQAALNKKPDWKNKSTALQQAMKQARGGGGGGGEIPEPEDTRVECPYCQRKFEATTAERHIPHCKEKALKAGAGKAAGKRVAQGKNSKKK